MIVPEKIAGLLLAASLLTAALPGRAQDATSLRAADPAAHAIWLETLDLSQMAQDYGQPHAGKSVDGNPLTLNGVVYPHGIGTHANSELRHRPARRGHPLRGDGRRGRREEGQPARSRSPCSWTASRRRRRAVLHGGDAPKLLSVDLTGAQDADACGSATAATASTATTPTGRAPRSPWPTTPAKPANGGDRPDRSRRACVVPPPDPRPAIHGPRVVGATPGRPFLFLIPATGDGPLTYAAKNLPAGPDARLRAPASSPGP